MPRIAGFEESYTDGTGVRYTIFFQGCKHNCEECHNPQTHDFQGGTYIDVNTIINNIKLLDYLDGVTLSGGDPLFQASECAEIAKRIKSETNLNIWCYTGFTFEVLLNSKDRNIKELLKYIDVIVDGPYEKKYKSLAIRFRGSSNQRIIDVQKSIRENKTILLNLD